MRYFLHSFGQFFSGFKRNPIRNIATLGLLSVLFFVIFLLMMFSSLTNQSISGAEKKINLIFFIQKEIPDHKITLLKAELLHMQKKKDIESFTYTSEAQALQIFAKKYPERFSFWKRNVPSKNPMNASFSVTPKNKSISQLNEIFSSDAFATVIDIPRMKSTSKIRERSKKILDFLHFIEKGIALLIGVILIAIAGVTMALISSSFVLRQKEIFIMRLVGSPYSLIRAPFLIEGLLSTLIALVIGWGIFFIFRDYSLQKMFSIFSSREEAQSTITIVQAMWENFLSILPYMILVIIIFSLIISFISIERLLRKKRILQS